MSGTYGGVARPSGQKVFVEATRGTRDGTDGIFTRADVALEPLSW